MGDWLALVAVGQRRPTAYSLQPKKMCLSHPAFQDHSMSSKVMRIDWVTVSDITSDFVKFVQKMRKVVINYKISK